MTQLRKRERRRDARSRLTCYRSVERLENRSMLAGDIEPHVPTDDPCQSPQVILWLATPQEPPPSQPADSSSDEPPRRCDGNLGTKQEGDANLLPGITFDSDGPEPAPTIEPNCVQASASGFMSIPTLAPDTQQRSLPAEFIDRSMADLEFRYFETSVSGVEPDRCEQTQERLSDELLHDTVMMFALLEPPSQAPVAYERLDGFTKQIDVSSEASAGIEDKPPTISDEMLAAISKADAAIASIETPEQCVASLGKSMQRISNPIEVATTVSLIITIWPPSKKGSLLDFSSRLRVWLKCMGRRD